MHVARGLFEFPLKLAYDGLVGIVLAVAMPFGMLIFGPMADTISVEWILVLTGVLAVLVTFGAAWRAPAALGPSRLPDAASSP